jgi:hypothetical protein
MGLSISIVVRISAGNTMEMTMRKKVLTVLVILLVAALTAQATAASAHHARTKACVVASERLRNSNAYFAAPCNSNGYLGFGSQEALRAAHPITQGGTTGGTVNPGLTHRSQDARLSRVTRRLRAIRGV